MLCNRCGREISSTAKFCPACGSSAVDPPYTPGAGLGLSPATNAPQVVPGGYAPPPTLSSDT
jgi:predicted amidophosphoribosyltransferase